MERLPYQNCPLCNSTKSTLLATADCSRHELYDPRIPAKMDWLKCEECEHVYTAGYFGDDINEVLFAKAQRTQLPGHNPELGRAIAGRIVDRVAVYALPPGKWLDVGFGDGALLGAVQEWGYTPYGIDMRAEAVEKLKAQGIAAHQCGINELSDREGSITVISLADVLEHVPFPGGTLRAASKLLNEDGALFVSCPNMACQAWHQLTAASINPYWMEIEHFHNFTRVRLTGFLADHGFKVVKFGISERYRLGMELIAVKV